MSQEPAGQTLQPTGLAAVSQVVDLRFFGGLSIEQLHNRLRFLCGPLIDIGHLPKLGCIRRFTMTAATIPVSRPLSHGTS